MAAAISLFQFQRRKSFWVGEVLNFWFKTLSPEDWFRQSDNVDAQIQRRFAGLHRAARSGAVDEWSSAPESALARIIVLDQFSRNLHRDSAGAFGADPIALRAASHALARRFDFCVCEEWRSFFYMPFMHAEDLAAQKRSVALFKARLPHTNNLKFARIHRNVIARFGRFPHRNDILGRRSTNEERAFLKAGGFNP